MWGRHDDLSNISEILKYVWTQIAAMGGLCFAMCRRGSSLCPSSMFGCGLEWMVDGGCDGGWCGRVDLDFGSFHSLKLNPFVNKNCV